MNAIRADHLSKNYKLRRERTRTLKETVLRQDAPTEQGAGAARRRHLTQALSQRDTGLVRTERPTQGRSVLFTGPRRQPAWPVVI